MQKGVFWMWFLSKTKRCVAEKAPISSWLSFVICCEKITASDFLLNFIWKPRSNSRLFAQILCSDSNSGTNPIRQRLTKTGVHIMWIDLCEIRLGTHTWVWPVAVVTGTISYEKWRIQRSARTRSGERGGQTFWAAGNRVFQNARYLYMGDNSKCFISSWCDIIHARTPYYVDKFDRSFPLFGGDRVASA